MQLPERTPPEVGVLPVEHHHLLRAQTGVIQGAEQRVVTSGRGVLAGSGDPTLEEIEEPAHPLGHRRHNSDDRVVTDMPRRVELIERARQPHPERGDDLGGLADLQEPMKPPEHLQVVPPGRRGPAFRRQRSDYPIDILRGDLPRRATQRREHPL
jgi:hypothetical protein